MLRLSHKRLFKPVQVVPFPLKLSRQVQKKLPTVSVQLAYTLQLSVARTHSSISAEKVSVPIKDQQ